MMILRAAQDYDSLNWLIILRTSSDTSGISVQVIFFTLLGFGSFIAK